MTGEQNQDELLHMHDTVAQDKAAHPTRVPLLEDGVKIRGLVDGRPSCRLHRHVSDCGQVRSDRGCPHGGASLHCIRASGGVATSVTLERRRRLQSAMNSRWQVSSRLTHRYRANVIADDA
jgi:hypothetical protein